MSTPETSSSLGPHTKAPGVLDSTGALAWKEVPKRMLILGGGMVGTHAGDMIGEIPGLKHSNFPVLKW